MRRNPPQVLESFRIWDGQYGSPPGAMHGVFCIRRADNNREMVVMSSGHDKHYGWEHVSVSFTDRAPTWEEMCMVKELFWDDDELVVQYHPKKADYVNYHPHCLHLWKPTRRRLPTPPTILVGPKKEHKDVQTQSG